jgi:hypothetical protein
MRLAKITFYVAALALSSFPAFAQQATGTPVSPVTTPPPAVTSPPTMTGEAPVPGTPLLPGTTTGLDKVGDDGISTKTVKAVPCGTVARETDGFTTCVGIPDNPKSPSKLR